MKNFKILALSKGISEITFDSVMNNARFLPKLSSMTDINQNFMRTQKLYFGEHPRKSDSLNYYKNNKEIIKN